jgi:hypothetical protein
MTDSLSPQENPAKDPAEAASGRGTQDSRS